jgi:hypothetical protein
MSVTRNAVATVSLSLALWGQFPAAQSDQDLVGILARMSDYLRRYETELSAVVAEERYEQWIETGGSTPNASPGRVRESAGPGPTRRILISEFLMIRWPGESAWLGFRDVMFVDGVVVRNRQERLVKLFTEGPADVLERAEQISRESARYNIGTVARNINVPTQALDVLHPRLNSRFSFRHLGAEAVEGAQAERIAFEETKPPYLVQTPSGQGVRTRGLAWIDHASGAVLQTQLDLVVAEPRNQLRSRVSVTFRVEPGLGIRVPAQLRETHEQFDPAGRVGGAVQTHGRAEYSKFRRFVAETRELIK